MNDLPKRSRRSCRFFRRYRSDPPTPIRAATRSNRRMCTTPGSPRWIGQRHARVAHPRDPRGDRVRVEAHLRRQVGRVRLLLLERREQTSSGIDGMTFRIARPRRSASNGCPSSSMRRSSASPSWISPRSFASPPTTNALPDPGRPAPLEQLRQVRPVADHVRRQVRRRRMPARDQPLAELDRRLDPVASVMPSRSRRRRAAGLRALERVAERDELEQRPLRGAHAHRTTSGILRGGLPRRRPDRTRPRVNATDRDATSPSGSPSSGPSAASARRSRRPCPSGSRPRAPSPARCARSAASRARCSSPAAASGTPT